MTLYYIPFHFGGLLGASYDGLKVFWGYLDKQTKETLLGRAVKSTVKGTDDARKVEEEVNKYRLTGLLG